MPTKKLATKVILCLAFAFTSINVLGQTAPNPNEVYIKRLTYSGPGCPTGSVAHNLAVDAKAFTLLFDSLFAEVGPTTPNGFAKNSCRVTVDLRFPQGWSYSLFDVDYRGYVSLDAGIRATQRSTYYFQANPRAAKTFATHYEGPLDQDYMIRDTIPVDDLNWSPCGRTRALNLDTEVQLDGTYNPQGQGLITVDSIDGELTQIYGIRWTRC